MNSRSNLIGNNELSTCKVVVFCPSVSINVNYFVYHEIPLITK